MESDIKNFITLNFPDNYNYLQNWTEGDSVIPKSEKNRVLRSILYLTQKDSKKLKDLIQLMESDYRDILWQAEYDCTDVRKRDFTKPLV